MTSADMLPTALLARKAIVYVRQSTQSQVMTNLEGQRRQYDLVDIARQRGFRDVEVIPPGAAAVRLRETTVTSSKEAFVQAGLEFIPENGAGVGVRFLKPQDRTE